MPPGGRERQGRVAGPGVWWSLTQRYSSYSSFKSFWCLNGGSSAVGLLWGHGFFQAVTYKAEWWFCRGAHAAVLLSSLVSAATNKKNKLNNLLSIQLESTVLAAGVTLNQSR